MIPKLRPPTPPGEILLEEFLKPMRLTQTALAEKMSVPLQRVNTLINGKRAVTADTALPLSEISTSVVAAVTSNVRLAAMPGNVRLRKGEANLPRASVVNVSQIGTVDRERLVDRVGSLGPARLREVLNGVGLVLGLEGVEGET